MTTVVTNIPGGSTVIWESVITNVGGGYQPGTGESICQDDGLYYFAISIVSEVDNRVDLHLIHDGNVVTTTLAHSSYNYDASTVSAVVECTNGQRVWVRCRDGTLCSILGFASLHFTSFSGFRIGS